MLLANHGDLFFSTPPNKANNSRLVCTRNASRHGPAFLQVIRKLRAIIPHRRNHMIHIIDGRNRNLSVAVSNVASHRNGA